MSAWDRLSSIARRRPLVTAAVLAVVLVLFALAAVYGALQTRAGGAALARLIEWQFEGPDGAAIKIHDLGGQLPGRIRIAGIDIIDKEDVWLTARDVQLDWRPMTLFTGRLAIDTLAVSEISVARRPVAGEPSAKSGNLALPPIEILVERIAIDHLQLADPVMGVPATLQAEASAAFIAGDFRAALVAARTDGTAGNADLALAYDAATRAFDFNATLSEPEGGVLARLLDMPGAPRIDISVAGDGPPEDWNGHLRATAEGLAEIDSTIVLGLGETMRVALQGAAKLGPAMDERSRALLGPETTFAVELERPGGAAAITLSVSNLESPAMTANGAVTVDPDSGGLQGNLSINALDGARFVKLTAPVRFTGGDVAMTVSGNLSLPSFGISLRLETFALDDIRANHATLDLTLARTEIGDWRTTGEGARLSTAGFVSGFAELDSLLGANPTAESQLAYHTAESLLEFAGLSIAGQVIEVDTALTIDLADIAVQADGGAGITDLSPLSGPLKRPLAGAGDITYAVNWHGRDGLRLDLAAQLHNARFGAPALETLTGDEVAVAGQITRDPDGTWRFNGLNIDGTNVDMTGTASIAAVTQTLDANYAVTVTDLRPLGLARPGTTSGRLSVKGTAHGPPGDPTVEGSAELVESTAGGIILDRLDVGYRIRSAVSGPSGTVSFKGSGPLVADVDGRFDMALRGSQLNLSALQVTARRTTVTGELAIPTSGGAVTGNLKGSAPDLAGWSDLAGTPLGGRAELVARLEAVSGQQVVRVEATGTAVTLGTDFRAEKIVLDGRVLQSADSPTISLKASGQSVTAGVARMKSVSVDASGTLDDATVAIRLSGEMRGPLSLAMDGRYRSNNDGNVLDVARLTGVVAGAPIELAQPVAIRHSPVIEMKSLNLAIGDGRITGQFSMTDEVVALRIAAKNIPFVLLLPGLPPQFETATVDVDAAMSGPPARPDATFRITTAGLAAGETEAVSGGLILTLDGRLRAGTLSIDGNIAGLDEVETSITATVPVQLSLSPVSASLNQSGKASGQLSFAGPVATAWALTGLDGHRLTGRADVRLGLSGSLADPRIQGHAKLSGGRYENLTTGTILSNMDLVATPSASAIVIDSATAGDGNGGRVTASGRIGFGGTERVTMDLNAAFEKARLMRRDEVTATASGSIQLTGTAADRLIAGQLDIQEAEIRIIGGLPASIVTLNVVETGTMPDRPPPPPPARPSRTRLDLDISMAKRIFVRGRGLDSEWGGRLKVSGTLSEPRVLGELRPLRGRYDLAGLNFALRDGVVDFTGGNQIDPTLDLSAERSARDLTAIIRVTGTANRPLVKMESIPELPQDEVLSRLLFNKSTGRLSPAEALRLSSAVATLSGTGGEGLVGFAREMLSLDVLQLNSSDGDEGESAAAGKYLSDRVYLGVEQGTTAGSTTATVEIDITPRLKIESDVGPTEKSQVGIKWKRDY